MAQVWGLGSHESVKYFKKQIVGMIGIGSPPEFITRLMWNKFSKKKKQEIIFEEYINYNGEYGIDTYQLVRMEKRTHLKKFIQKLITMILEKDKLSVHCR